MTAPSRASPTPGASASPGACSRSRTCRSIHGIWHSTPSPPNKDGLHDEPAADTALAKAGGHARHPGADRDLVHRRRQPVALGRALAGAGAIAVLRRDRNRMALAAADAPHAALDGNGTLALMPRTIICLGIHAEN